MGYDDLVIARKRCRVCIDRGANLRNGSELDFDPSVVSHWSRWLGHRSPEILIIGQDFSDIDYFERNRGRDDATSPTNSNLCHLLGAAGIHVGVPGRHDETAPVYLTNSILCMKSGEMTSPIRHRWVKTCTDQNLGPLVAHLRPLVVVAMGFHAWSAARRLFQLQGESARITEVAGSCWVIPGGTYVFAVGHCSRNGLRSRIMEQQLADWRKIGDALAYLRDTE